LVLLAIATLLSDGWRCLTFSPGNGPMWARLYVHVKIKYFRSASL